MNTNDLCVRSHSLIPVINFTSTSKTMMFVTQNNQLSQESRASCRKIQNDFLRRLSTLSRPPRSADDVRFYIVDWTDQEVEGDQGLINAGLNYFNNTGWENTGGTWLNQLVEDGDKVYAIAAAWW